MNKGFVLAFLGILGDIVALWTYLLPFCEREPLSLPRFTHLLSVMPTVLKMELLIFNIVVVSLIVVPIVYDKYFKKPKSHAKN